MLVKYQLKYTFIPVAMMSEGLDTRARAVYDGPAGRILASVDLPAGPERVFRALTGAEVTRWWVNPGVFDTREWKADLRVGGHWRASGVGRGQPYALEGEFMVLEDPRKLVHSWRSVGGPPPDSTVTYLVDSVPRGTHLTIRHEGFKDPVACIRTCRGWETSLAELVNLLSSDK